MTIKTQFDQGYPCIEPFLASIRIKFMETLQMREICMELSQDGPWAVRAVL